MNSSIRIMKAITTALMIVLSAHICFSQNNKIERLTFSIVDTTKSKYEQVHNIYKWITENIRYDTKAYLKGRSDNSSALETLKKRKGICSDYSLLFSVMCSCIGIESHLVIGYSKGLDYFKGGGFYDINHCWNAFRVDTIWFLADATWGSGYVKKSPSRMDKIKHAVFKTPYANTKYIFVKAPTDEYFNPSSEFRNSHLPLYVNWQLSHPVSTIKQFESDTFVVKDSHYKGFNYLFGNSESLQLYQEGISGKDFNRRNNFNIANGIIAWADDFNCLTVQVQKDNLPTFADGIKLYKKALYYADKHQITIDSVYKERLGFIKRNHKKAAKIYSNISKKTNTGETRYTKTLHSLSSRRGLLTKKIFKFEKLLPDFQQELMFNNDIIPKPDSLEYARICRDISSSSKKIMKLESQIDTLSKTIYKSIAADSILSIVCLSEKRTFNEGIMHFKPKLNTEDNAIIYPYWKGIDDAYDHTIKNLKLKNANNSLVLNKFNLLQEKIYLLAMEYNLQINLLKRFYSYQCDYKNTAFFFDKLQQSLYKSYNYAIDFCINYQILINHLMQFNAEYKGLNVLLRNSGTIINIAYFIKYGNELFSIQKRGYEHEKNSIKYIKNKSGKALTKIENKMGNYQEQNKQF